VYFTTTETLTSRSPSVSKVTLPGSASVSLIEATTSSKPLA